jgi:UDP-N-acetylmuramyl tripeptide synthase
MGAETKAETRSQSQMAREVLKLAKEQGVVREYAVRPGGRATIYPTEGRGKFYAANVLDVLAILKQLGFDPDKS